MRHFVCLGLFSVVAHAGVLSTGQSRVHRADDGIGNYEFGYDEDHASGGSFRRERGNNLGVKIGSYGLRDADGRYRVVNYVADGHGFRATVSTNEPGTAPSQTGSASYNSAPLVTSSLVNTAPIFGARVSYGAPVVKAPIVAPAPIYSTPISRPSPVYSAPLITSSAHVAPVVQYAAPVAKVSAIRTYAAPVQAYSVPVAKVAAPVTPIVAAYAAPNVKAVVPVSPVSAYGTPVASTPLQYAAPIAKIRAAPIVSYQTPLNTVGSIPVATYRAPAVRYTAAPHTTYAAPISTYAVAPLAKVASPVIANSIPQVRHSFSTYTAPIQRLASPAYAYSVPSSSTPAPTAPLLRVNNNDSLVSVNNATDFPAATDVTSTTEAIPLSLQSRPLQPQSPNNQTNSSNPPAVATYGTRISAPAYLRTFPVARPAFYASPVYSASVITNPSYGRVFVTPVSHYTTSVHSQLHIASSVVAPSISSVPSVNISAEVTTAPSASATPDTITTSAPVTESVGTTQSDFSTTTTIPSPTNSNDEDVADPGNSPPLFSSSRDEAAASPVTTLGTSTTETSTFSPTTITVSPTTDSFTSTTEVPTAAEALNYAVNQRNSNETASLFQTSSPARLASRISSRQAAYTSHVIRAPSAIRTFVPAYAHFRTAPVAHHAAGPIIYSKHVPVTYRVPVAYY